MVGSRRVTKLTASSPRAFQGCSVRKALRAAKKKTLGGHHWHRSCCPRRLKVEDGPKHIRIRVTWRLTLIRLSWRGRFRPGHQNGQGAAAGDHFDFRKRAAPKDAASFAGRLKPQQKADAAVRWSD